MNRIFIVISTPVIFGVALIALVFFNLGQFNSGTIGVHTMLSRELPVVILGFLSCLVVGALAIIWLIKKRRLLSLYSGLSVFMFVVSFLIAGLSGGAFLNAT